MFGLFKRNQKEQKPKYIYHEVTCLDLKCMEKLAHTELLFQLIPPAEVVDYWMRKRLGGGMSAMEQPAAAIRKPERKTPPPSAKKKTKKKDDLDFDAFSSFDDIDDEEPTDYYEEVLDKIAPVTYDDYDINDDNNDYTAEMAPTAVAADARLDEMVQYYYEQPNDRTRVFNDKADYYVYGGGEQPNFIHPRGALNIKQTNGLYPREAYKEFHRDEIDTNYVTRIVDSYGNGTQRAVCPHCFTPIWSSKAGLYKTFIIPVVGVSQSGKTYLITDGLIPFMKRTVSKMLPRGTFSQDDSSKAYLKEISKKIMTELRIESTNEITLISGEITSGEKLISVCTYDLPGEYIANPIHESFRQNELRRLLNRADAMIIVFCPEQIEDITKLDLGIKKTEVGDSMNMLTDMIRKIKIDSDPNDSLKRREMPISVIMTKLDMFHDGDYTDKINPYIDTGKLSHEAREMMYSKDGILERAEISVRGDEEKDVVDIGVIGRFSQRTSEFFNEVINNEINAVYNAFATENIFNINCFATSIAGRDEKGRIDRLPIRPYEPFYWLFAKIGIYKRTGMEANANGANKKTRGRGGK